MTIFRSAILFLFGCLLTEHIEAQLDEFMLAPTPEWVNEVEIPDYAISKYDVSSGVYGKLVDTQVNLNQQADFSRVVLEVLTQGGVRNASELYISYDPAYQKVEFHHFKIIRNGNEIDKTDELTFEKLNTEESLGFGIYTGVITAYEILNDIRKGDILDYAYTIYGDNPIFDNSHFRYYDLVSSEPTGRYSIRLITDDQKYKVRCQGCEDELKKAKGFEGHDEISIVRNEIPGEILEESVPPWYLVYDHLIFTTDTDWKGVSDWAVNIFQYDENLDFSAIKNEIGLEGLDQEAQMNAIIDFVQDDIRYMGIETGIGSIQPFPPDQVIAQRFGDCKDKSLLMSALFHSIGVDKCYPVLVNTGLMKGIESLYPSPTLFDHVIVHFEYKGKEYWVDPTSPFQGGDFKTLSQPDFMTSLIIKPGNSKLTAMDINHSKSTIRIDETLNIPSFEDLAEFVVVTEYGGSNADYFRNILEYYSLVDLTEEFRLINASIFPNIEASSRLKVNDDIENNVLTIEERYLINDFWSLEQGEWVRQNQFQYEPLSMYNYVSTAVCDKKEYPVYVPHPSDVQEKVTIHFPEELFVEDEVMTMENAAFTFERSINMPDDKTVIMNHTYKTHVDEIKPEEFKLACNHLNDIVSKLPMIFYFPLKEDLLKQFIESED
ncbi:MAG: DUF3857 domain-containing protein [Flavobacteriales bacterium]|nr:DUF3857 domain-containing protein [Flavobacteriales bacterium]